MDLSSCDERSPVIRPTRPKQWRGDRAKRSCCCCWGTLRPNNSIATAAADVPRTRKVLPGTISTMTTKDLKVLVRMTPDEIIYSHSLLTKAGMGDKIYCFLRSPAARRRPAAAAVAAAVAAAAVAAAAAAQGPRRRSNGARSSICSLGAYFITLWRLATPATLSTIACFGLEAGEDIQYDAIKHILWIKLICTTSHEHVTNKVNCNRADCIDTSVKMGKNR